MLFPTNERLKVMEICESCGKSAGTWHVAWYLLDDNAEVTLCRKCVAELRGIGETVERIPA